MTLYNYAIQSWHMDEDGAWEIIYKVLFKITEHINKYSFESEPQFRNMLFTIFNNELINFYHKTKKIEERIKFLKLDENSIENSVSNQENTADREISETIIKNSLEAFWDNPQNDNPLLNCLNNLLDELEDWERILINQRSKGIPYREIAHFIDKPENQLKVYYSRLKNRIQTKLIEVMRHNQNE